MARRKRESQRTDGPFRQGETPQIRAAYERECEELEERRKRCICAEKSGREKESDKKDKGKIGAETTFSRKGRGECNERWGKTRRREKARERKEKRIEERKSETDIIGKQKRTENG